MTDIETVLHEHYEITADLTTPRMYTQRGGWIVSCGCGAAIGETGDDDLGVRHIRHQAVAVLAVLAEHVTNAVTEHAGEMETYTLPSLTPGYLEGWGQALGLLRRDAAAIASRVTSSAIPEREA